MAAIKGSKKREAPSHGGPPNKKRKEKNSITFEAEKSSTEKLKASAIGDPKLSKSPAVQQKAQRKIPVTSSQPVGESSGSESDVDEGDTEDADVLSDGLVGDEGDFEGVEEEEAEFEDGGLDESGASVGGEEVPQKKTSASIPISVLDDDLI